MPNHTHEHGHHHGHGGTPTQVLMAEHELILEALDALEMLDLVHRIYEADESFKSLDFMVHTQLYVPHIVIQILLGTMLPIALLGVVQLVRLREGMRKGFYATAGVLTLIGIFAMRWNVVIGGQLFSKSFLGYTTYKLEFATREGLLPSIAILVLPFIILWVLVKLLPPWEREEPAPSRMRV